MNRALLVGIDVYAKFGRLHGCVNDVNALEPLMSRHHDGAPNFACVRRINDVTRDGLLGDIEALLGGRADVALLYYAGHGSPADGDVALGTTDGTRASPGVLFSQVLPMIARSATPEVIVILDCCFAGAAGGVPQLGVKTSALRNGVSILTASRAAEGSEENRNEDKRGAFSTFLEGGLDGGAADVLGRVTVAGLYSYLDESFGAWGPRPVFKANVDRLHELRLCEPAVPLHELRRISKLFPDPDESLPLDPSYEPDAEPANAEHEAIFAILQRYRAAKLVEPIDAAHLYFAAMQSTGCRLTPLGRHYHHMARERLI